MKRLVIRTLMALPLACFAVAAPAQQIDEAKKATVKITAQAEGEKRAGTGFIAKLDQGVAYIVTASHVIEGDSSPKVCFYPDAQTCLPAKIVGSEGGLPRGLALIRVTEHVPTGLAHLGIDATFDLKASEQATLVGFPRLAATPWAITPITIVGRQGTVITFTGAADEGSSGSPVIRNGWVTALVVEKSGDFGYAVPAAAVRFAIEGWGLKLSSELQPLKADGPVKADSRLAATKILFMSKRDPSSTSNMGEIYTMDINGKDVRRVPIKLLDAHDVTWSRDGESVTYIADSDPREAGVFQTRLVDKAQSTVFSAFAYFASPVWSRDGRSLAFLANTSIDRDYRDVFVSSAKGSKVRLTQDSSQKVSLFWSPKADRIGYADISDKHLRTFMMNADGTNLQQLSSPLTDFAATAWSPAGKLIGNSTRDGYWAIYTMNDDGSDPKQLTHDPQGDFEPDWSPDGTEVVFTSKRDGHEEIYTMNADGSNQVRLTHERVKSYAPQWSPFLANSHQ